jgi:hypothetical protein
VNLVRIVLLKAVPGKEGAVGNRRSSLCDRGGSEADLVGEDDYQQC